MADNYKRCIVTKEGLTEGKTYVAPPMLKESEDEEHTVFVCNDFGDWKCYPLEWFAPLPPLATKRYNIYSTCVRCRKTDTLADDSICPDCRRPAPASEAGVFDHPCKQTCSGWKQAYERGHAAASASLREKLEKVRERLELIMAETLAGVIRVEGGRPNQLDSTVLDNLARDALATLTAILEELG